MDRSKSASYRGKVSGMRRMDKISKPNGNIGSSKKIPLPKWDFKTLDQKIKFAFRQERTQDVKKLGYHYLTEAIVKLYRKHKSSYKVGKILNVTSVSVLYILKRIGEPLNGRGCYLRNKNK